MSGFGVRPEGTMLGTEQSTVLDNGDIRVTVHVPRDEETGTMGVDIDEWQGLVTVGVISSDAPFHRSQMSHQKIACTQG